VIQKSPRRMYGRVTNIRISAHSTHLRKFRNFVFATEVTIFSDHNPLMYLRECAPAKSAKLTRWALGLQEFMHADSNIFHTSVVLFHIYRVYKKVAAQTHGPILSWVAAIRNDSNVKREDRRAVSQAHQLWFLSLLFMSA